MKADGFVPEHASRFALYDLVPEHDRFILGEPRYVSTTVDEVYQAMRHNPRMPDKDWFVKNLNKKLKLSLSIKAV